MASSLWNHNIHYYDFVLSLAAPGCQRALDVGCGPGLLARLLAQRCQEVVAIDMDHDAISRARVGGLSSRSIEFIEGDVMTHPFSPASFDLIALSATLHHLHLRPALIRMQELLKPGGVLAVVGLCRAETINDYARAAIAFPASWIFRLFRGYADVGAPVEDARETLSEIRSACHDLLPGACLRRRLFFRYSLSWRKPLQ